MVGFVVNPSAFHLGCSPDRRVYDPDATEAHGLLEVKCPSINSITKCKYLVKDGATHNPSPQDNTSVLLPGARTDGINWGIMV